MGRPQTRAECGTERPCPYVGCRYHLIWEHSGVHGNDDDQLIELLEEMPETCALDVADQGGTTLQEIGDAMGLTRERVRQMIYGGGNKYSGARAIIPRMLKYPAKYDLTTLKEFMEA